MMMIKLLTTESTQTLRTNFFMRCVPRFFSWGVRCLRQRTLTKLWDAEFSSTQSCWMCKTTSLRAPVVELKFVASILSMFLRYLVTATEVEMQATNLKEQKEARGQRAWLLFFLTHTLHGFTLFMIFIIWNYFIHVIFLINF